MKKIILSAITFCLFAFGTANAQSEQTEAYFGAEQGSFAITVGADPVINFVGNMFNGTEDNSLSGLCGRLEGKYYLSNAFSVKAGVRFNNSKTKRFTYNPDDKDKKEVINEWTQGSREFDINLGLQYNFRAGKRMQPFIGADIFYGRINSNFDIDEDFNATWEEMGHEVNQIHEYTKTSTPTNAFGFFANIGIEYFIGKKVSISAAFDLGVYVYNKKQISEFKTESGEYTGEEIDAKNYSMKTSKTTRFGTGLMNGNIAFNFYF